MGVAIKHHRIKDVTDINADVVVEAVDAPGSGGAHHAYRLSVVGSRLVADIPLHHLAPGEPEEINGFTNEALLAIVIHRLECFQTGPFACGENEAALANVKTAMSWLHRRTKARIKQGVEGKLVAHGPSRINVINGVVTIGGKASFVLDKLRTEWGAWSDVGSTLSRLDPPATVDEIEQLANLAETTAAKRGIAEMKSFLATAAKA